MIMTMAIFRDDITRSFELVDNAPETYSTTEMSKRPVSGRIPYIESKLKMPLLDDHMTRKRLMGQAERSTQNYAGTLMVGRAGSGKTHAAIDLVSRYSNVFWYSIDAADTDHGTFCRYFRFGLLRDVNKKTLPETYDSPGSFLETFADITAGLELQEMKWPEVIVLDSIHHLFDRYWFTEFFSLLFASIPHSSHVIMLSRSKPPNPLWRLRSKQILNVIDERTLAFTDSETRDLFDRNGLTRDDGKKAFSCSFGRPETIFRILKEQKVAMAK